MREHSESWVARYIFLREIIMDMLGIIAITASIAAALVYVMFGKPEKPEPQAPERVERVEPAVSQSPTSQSPTSQSSTSSVPVTTSTTAPIANPITDPWDDTPATSSGVMAPATAAIATAMSFSTPAQSAAPASDHPAPTSASMPPFAAIQDPQRPSTPALQDLSQEILTMGQSQQLRYVPKLAQYATHSDPMIRRYVANALGQIAAPHTVTAEIETVIPVLGKLSQDSSLEVRQMALRALSGIQSPLVLPYLEKGLLSASGSVQQMANAAIQKLKLQYDKPTSVAPQFPPALQKKPG
jgi:HEAT repeats